MTGLDLMGKTLDSSTVLKFARLSVHNNPFPGWEVDKGKYGFPRLDMPRRGLVLNNIFLPYNSRSLVHF
jgi:hypothetical protein